jgi:hypothetical protein
MRLPRNGVQMERLWVRSKDVSFLKFNVSLQCSISFRKGALI